MSTSGTKRTRSPRKRASHNGFDPTVAIPDIAPDCDRTEAALRYAAAGLYVLPCAPRTKHPGGLVGEGWQHRSSQDPNTIKHWWRLHPDAEIALHIGRSGLVAFDVDNPSQVPALLDQHLAAAPFQTTRLNSERGHYLFRTPPDRRFGNSTGSLGKAWGQVRGNNGVLIRA